MTVHQQAYEVGAFAQYLRDLVARLDPGRGWYGVFARRDPAGMRSCLDGVEIPPWDVVESLLADLAALHGARFAEQVSVRAAALYSASAAAHDRRPGGRQELVHRLELMVREQRRAAERLRGTGPGAPDPAEPEALAWARDDHDRATARCTELRKRLAAVAAPEGWFRAEDGEGPRAGAGGAAGAAVPGSAGAAVSGSAGPAGAGRVPRPRAEAGGAVAGHPHGRGPGTEGEPARADGPARDRPAEAFAPEAPGGWGPEASEAQARLAAGSYVGTEPSGTAELSWAVEPHRPAEPHEASEGQARLAAGSYVGTEPSGTAELSGASRRRGATEPSWAAESHGVAGPFGVAGGFEPSGTAEPHRPAEPHGAPEPHRPAEPHGVPEPSGGPDAPAPRRKKPRGARFAGLDVDDEEAAAYAPSPLPGPPEPDRSGAPAPRGARFGGAAAEAEDHGGRGRGRAGRGRGADGAADPVVPDPAAGQAVAGAVAQLLRLRAEGRSGEAHVVLCEVAAWPAPRLPVLALALHRAGLAADWTTLLWEASSLPPAGFAAAAGALAAAGRDADCGLLLRQGVARPAAEVADAALALDGAGRQDQARDLLGAFVRVHTPQEAAELARAAGTRLLPLLLAAAREVSGEAEWDLVHALRVAGVPGV
ncbi:hypothetical protein G6W57_25500 [Streptomyces sp. CAI-121]|uniref:hypothetical protein n=1 Tax=unclassified Streptomyces TaxID=2593676 RepID=UPI00158702E2|nr:MULTISPECIES: hypothetical protein [unclassified Streptomyces]NUV70467.1 hypothetical protein [Streptomyces sp. CAI-121]NUW16625.1 hypothetical protein [Streptomyces sp. CAI-68]